MAAAGAIASLHRNAAHAAMQEVRSVIKLTRPAGGAVIALALALTSAAPAAAAQPTRTVNHDLTPFTIPAGQDRKSTRLNSSHIQKSRMPSSA